MARSLFAGSYGDTVGGAYCGRFANGENRNALRKRKKPGTQTTAEGVTSCRVVSESLWQLWPPSALRR